MRSYQLHPATRSIFVQNTMALLYKPTREYMHQKLSQIILDNSKACGNNHKCMSYRGRYYSVDRTRRFPGPANMLHRSLRSRIKAWEEEQRLIEEEESSTSAYVLAALQIAPYPEMLRKMLPEALHSVINSALHHLPSGDCELSSKEIAIFMEHNKKYLLLIKRRLTMNLIERS